MKYYQITYECIWVLWTFAVVREALISFKRWIPPELLPEHDSTVSGLSVEEKFERQRLRRELLLYSEKRNTYDYRLLIFIVATFSFSVIWQLLYRWTGGSPKLGLKDSATYYELASSIVAQVFNLLCIIMLLIFGFKSFIKNKVSVAGVGSRVKSWIFILGYIFISIPHFITYWDSFRENRIRLDAVEAYQNYSDSLTKIDAVNKLLKEVKKPEKKEIKNPDPVVEEKSEQKNVQQPNDGKDFRINMLDSSKVKVKQPIVIQKKR